MDTNTIATRPMSATNKGKRGIDTPAGSPPNCWGSKAVTTLVPSETKDGNINSTPKLPPDF
jgi:hypothetical protein